MKPPKVYQFIVEVSDAEDEGYLFAEAVADVSYEIEALGKGSQ